MRLFKKKKVEKIDPKKDPWKYYKTRMTAAMAGGWEVKEETKWYADLVKDNSKPFTHILIFCIAPIIGNIIYYYTSRDTKRILKPIRQ